MTARVEWLPVGHIPHGYRRLFVLFENETLRHVVNLAPLPYELVYSVKEMAGPDGVEDPSLWWGLSVITTLVSDGTLLGATNPETADDGYLQVRPQPPVAADLIPLAMYQTTLQQGAYVFAH